MGGSPPSISTARISEGCLSEPSEYPLFNAINSVNGQMMFGRSRQDSCCIQTASAIAE